MLKSYFVDQGSTRVVLSKSYRVVLAWYVVMHCNLSGAVLWYCRDPKTQKNQIATRRTTEATFSDSPGAGSIENKPFSNSDNHSKLPHFALDTKSDI